MFVTRSRVDYVRPLHPAVESVGGMEFALDCTTTEDEKPRSAGMGAPYNCTQRGGSSQKKSDIKQGKDFPS